MDGSKNFYRNNPFSKEDTDEIGQIKQTNSGRHCFESRLEDIREKALHLEGVMIKLGQYLSTRKDMMPTVYISGIIRFT